MKIFPIASFLLTGVTALVLTQSPVAAALSTSQVEAIARQVTVKIDASNPGSGVIIQREGNTYTLLTAAHVIDTKDDYEVVIDGGQRYAIIPGSINKIPNIDLATVKFVSEQPLEIAELGNSNEVRSGDPCFVSGHPLKLSTHETQYRFSIGHISANSSVADESGYSMAYLNDTYRGMSGGPVLNNQGQVIGIHGRTLSPLKSSGGIDDLGMKAGISMAIPINTYLGKKNLFNSPAEDLFMAGVNAVTEKEFSADIIVEPLLQAIKGDPIAVHDAWETQMKPWYDRHRQAIQYMNQALQFNPNYGSAYIMRGLSHQYIWQLEEGRADHKAALLNKGVELPSENGTADLNKGTATSPEEAMADLTKGIALSPETPIVYYYRARLYSNMGKDKEAFADIKRWQQLDPDNPSIGLLTTEIQRDHDSKAVYAPLEALNHTLQKDPNNVKALVDKAELLMNSNANPDEALQLLNRAIELDPNNEMAYMNRARLHHLLRNEASMAQDFSLVLQQFSKRFSHIEGFPESVLPNHSMSKFEELPLMFAKLHLERADDLLQEKSFRLALNEVNKAIESDPTLAQAYITRGFIFYHLGKFTKASQDFQKAKETDPSLYESQEVDQKLKLLRERN